MRFLEDKIERVLKIDSEMINVTALHPHDEITVKHDILEVYDVTAKLMSFPTRTPKGELEGKFKEEKYRFKQERSSIWWSGKRRLSIKQMKQIIKL